MEKGRSYAKALCRLSRISKVRKKTMRCPYCNAVIQKRIGGRQYCSECFHWITPQDGNETPIEKKQTELLDSSYIQQTGQNQIKIQCTFCKREIFGQVGRSERVRCPYCHRMNFIPQNNLLEKQLIQTVQVDIQRKSTEGIEYGIENGEAVVVAYWGEEKQLIVGDEYNGKQITRIKENALKGNKNLESILLGKNIQIVEKEAFAECINLKKLKIEGEITEIQEGAFFRCVSLSKIEYKKKPKGIAVSAFSKCYNIPIEIREQLIW